MTLPDHELVMRIRAGDEGAMADLYDRYAEPLLGLAYRILADRGEAEDVVLEALERAWREADRFDPGRGSVRAWLVVMVRTRALDRVRARRRQDRAALEVTLGDFVAEPNPAQETERDEARRLVRAALDGLTDLQRQAIELAYYGGLSQSEIAARLDAPLGTVKTRIRDGMTKLKTMLQPLYAGSDR